MERSQDIFLNIISNYWLQEISFKPKKAYLDANAHLEVVIFYIFY